MYISNLATVSVNFRLNLLGFIVVLSARAGVRLNNLLLHSFQVPSPYQNQQFITNSPHIGISEWQFCYTLHSCSSTAGDLQPRRCKQKLRILLGKPAGTPYARLALMQKGTRLLHVWDRSPLLPQGGHFHEGRCAYL